MRRLLQSAILAGATLVAGPLVPDASADHAIRVGKVRMGVSCGGLQISIGRRRAPARHFHDWRFSSRRVWVPPKYAMTIVGYDTCRRPIRRQRMVRAGFWRFVRVRSCCCGSVQDY